MSLEAPCARLSRAPLNAFYSCPQAPVAWTRTAKCAKYAHVREHVCLFEHMRVDAARCIFTAAVELLHAFRVLLLQVKARQC